MGKPERPGVTDARRAIVQGREPRFDLDLSYGQEGELIFATFIEDVARGHEHIEVKRKTPIDHQLYVESHHDPGDRGVFVESGISTTTATLWVYVVHDTGIHLAIPTEFLRARAATSPAAKLTRGSCPTRGNLVDFCSLLWWVGTQWKKAGR